MPDPQNTWYCTCQIPNIPARSPVCLPDPQYTCQIQSLPTRSPNLLACLLYEILLFNNFLKLIWSCWFHTWPLFYNFLCLWAFLAHLQKSKKRDFWGAIVQKQFVFKGYCKVLFWRTPTEKNDSLSCLVFSARKFCQDVRKFKTNIHMQLLLLVCVFSGTWLADNFVYFR